jgi:hypothetical protein
MRLTVRHLRPGSGLLLLSYISLHMTNYARSNCANRRSATRDYADSFCITASGMSKLA